MAILERNISWCQYQYNLEMLRKKFGERAVLLFFSASYQIICLVLCWIYLDFSHMTTPANDSSSSFTFLYRYYLEIAMVVLIGFGSRSVSMGYLSYGFTLLVVSHGYPWAIICHAIATSLYQQGLVTFTYKIPLDISSCIEGLFSITALIISMGATAGNASPVQFLIVSFLQIPFQRLSWFVGKFLLGAYDTGGTIFTHVFGAYFGLACSFAWSDIKKRQVRQVQTPRSTESSLSMIATFIIWIYFPSMNAVLAHPMAHQRAVINTILAMIGSTASSFWISQLVRGKFALLEVQKSAIAGGIAVGCTADIAFAPGFCLSLGAVIGVVGTISHQAVHPITTRWLHLQDACDVHSFHAIPGVFGAVASTAVATVATVDQQSSYNTYVALQSNGEWQALYQLIAVISTIGIAISGGLLSGLLTRCAFPPTKPFNGDQYWCYDEDLIPLNTAAA